MAVSDEEYTIIKLISDIREAAGDPEGRLMQDELVEHIRKMRGALLRMNNPEKFIPPNGQEYDRIIKRWATEALEVK